MEPEIKRIKLGDDPKEGGRHEQFKADNSLTSIQSTQKVTNDYQKEFLSSTKHSDEVWKQRNQIKHDGLKKESLASSNSSGNNVQLLSVVNYSQSTGTVANFKQNYCAGDKRTNISKAEQRAPVQNGSGQKLESIIGRLSSDKSAPAPNVNDDDTMICRADASTQTFPDFVKIVKCLVFRRMKQLEQSLIGGAVTDSVLNGKLVDLQRENRDLRRSVKKLQEKLDLILQSLKLDECNTSSKVKEILESTQNQIANDIVPDNSSPIRKQSAVVSPYHVQSSQVEGQAQNTRLKETGGRPRRESLDISIPQVKLPTTSNNIVNENANSFTPLTMQYSPVTRHGPQVKYVPQRFHHVPHQSGAPPSQFINLAQGGIVMQKSPVQRPRGLEYVPRPPTGPIIYTTQSVQVTGPRMSTIPPQPQQASQHGNQRPIFSPSGIGTRLSQPGQQTRPGGSMLRFTGSSPQTVHYIPQNFVPYMTQIQQNAPFPGHRIIAQGPSSEIREPLAVPQPHVLHGEHQQVHPSTSLPPPPPYQMTKTQSDQPSVASKVQVSQVNLNPVSRMPNEQVLPPKLQVNITVSGNGIVLSWDFESEPIVKVPAIECYHLFASQDSPTPPNTASEWKKIGVVKALPLPMACTLTQFVSGNSYHFAVLAVDVNGREGPLSNSCTVRLNN